MQIKVLAISGSSRQGSFNTRLLEAAISAARAQGVEVSEVIITQLDLRTLELPLYDGDLEAASGLPEGAIVLKNALAAHHAVLIASPEYNGFFSPLLKNAIDWASRPQAGQPSPFGGKVGALLAASQGALGGIRGLPAVRQLLSNLGMLVIPGQMALPSAQKAFDTAGGLLDPAQQQMLERVVIELLNTARALQVTKG